MVQPSSPAKLLLIGGAAPPFTLLHAPFEVGLIDLVEALLFREHAGGVGGEAVGVV